MPRAWSRGQPAFEPNYVVTDPQGSPLWIDLACPEYRLAVEYDGGHHLTPVQQHSDVLRNERTVSAGWRQLVVNKLDVRNGDAWVLMRVGQGTQRCPRLCGKRIGQGHHSRKVRDSNSWYGVTAHWFSRPAPSAARTTFPNQ